MPIVWDLSEGGKKLGVFFSLHADMNRMYVYIFTNWMCQRIGMYYIDSLDTLYWKKNKLELSVNKWANKCYRKQQICSRQRDHVWFDVNATSKCEFVNQ